MVQPNSSTDSSSPLGQFAGHATGVGTPAGFKFRSEEHGIILGILSVMPQPSYQQGLARQWTKFNLLDYAFPEFANLGEQAIKNSEIYAFDDETGSETFGYTPRYAEYKYAPSRVCGDFRKSLNFWHLGRIFKNPPKLNADFVQCKGDSDSLQRVFAAQDNKQHLWINIYNNVKRTSLLPKYGTPSIL